MKFVTPQHPNEFAASLTFDPQDIPILWEINERFIPRKYEEDPDAFTTSVIILQAMRTYFDEGLKVLKIDMTEQDYPKVTNKLHEATSELLSDNLAFWSVITTKYPGWLLQEKVDINSKPANSSSEEAQDPFNGVYLDQLEAKLKHLVALNKEFRATSNSVN